MRRFEFVEGTSSKFWSGDAEGATFVVVYGRIGTPGTRKEKVFPTADAAQRECDKKVAEKVREGYVEVGGAPAPVVAAPKIVAAPKLPPRGAVGKPTQAKIDRAVEALIALESELGGRSWRVTRCAHRAAHALGDLGLPSLSAVPGIEKVLLSLLDSVVAPAGSRRLSLTLALDLLYELDASAFTLALSRWKSPPAGSPACAALAALHGLSAAIRDPELSLRAARMLASRPDFGAVGEPAWANRWKLLRAHLHENLSARGSSVASVLSVLEPPRDPHLARRFTRMSTP